MTAVVLNSSQPKHPRCDAPWVRATLQAVEQLAARGCTLVSSVGLSAWELALWKAGAVGAQVQVVGLRTDGQDERAALAQVCDAFGLDPGRTTWHPVAPSSAQQRRTTTWPVRDELAIQRSDMVVPVSIRRGGRMAALLERPEVRTRCNDRYRVPYESTDLAPRWGAIPRRPREPLPERLLVHLTRASDGPWPGEQAADFYRALAEGERGDPRDAFATLGRIVRERRLRGASLRIRGAARAVSLSALDPWEALRLVGWRTSYARYAFEPYLVGVPLEWAREQGARPVVYDDGAAAATSSADAVFHQGRGEQGRWEAEQEWRVPGDLDLSRLDPARWVVFTATDQEAAQLREACGCRVVSFGYAAGGA